MKRGPIAVRCYGVDLVHVDRLGLRAPGLLPSDPSADLVFGSVVAPARDASSPPGTTRRT